LGRSAPPTPTDHGAATRRHPRALVRSANDRVIAGVAGGIGERLGMDPTVVRLAFVALSLAAGIGALLYLLGYLVSLEPEPGSPPTAAPPRTSARQALAAGLVVLGLLVLLREMGLWFGDQLVWPTALVALGSAVIWTRGDDSDRARWSRLVRRLPESSQELVVGTAPRVRLVIGALLVLAGLAQFLMANDLGDLRRSAPLGAVAGLVGIGVIAGPWFWRLGRQLAEERRQRIRSQERAEVAAHLHDSVLQTLALIQRSGDSREMATLARGQERELRAWLYDGRRAADRTLLSTALNDAAAEIERTHRVAIDVVTAGDCRIDEPETALVLAAREAMLNAATHSGARHVSVFVETDEAEIAAYIRDQGDGFDLASVSPDRRGIADSIQGRVNRYGGTANVVSVPAQGTEVSLRVPRRSS
jgi:signal transduction histidine kinase/phage shock protein PspC (stress-responsive transcriptional regulator)